VLDVGIAAPLAVRASMGALAGLVALVLAQHRSAAFLVGPPKRKVQR
jgi:hypothetical protein